MRGWVRARVEARARVWTRVDLPRAVVTRHEDERVVAHLAALEGGKDAAHLHRTGERGGKRRAKRERREERGERRVQGAGRSREKRECCPPASHGVLLSSEQSEERTKERGEGRGESAERRVQV